MTAAAVFDIGTNTVRCLAFRMGAEVYRAHRVVRLGQGVDQTGAFAAEAVDRAVSGLAELVAEAGPYESVDAVATSATRDAANRDVFLDRAEAVLGVRPRMISGDEEARLSFSGATGSVDAGVQGSVRHPTAPTLVIDVGGGSTEFVLGRTEPEYAISTDMGSVRLTERVIPERPTVRVAEAVSEALRVMAAVELPEPPGRVIGVAGTFTALGAIDLGLEAYDRERVHHHELHAESLDRIIAHLAGLTVEETARIPSLEPLRAPMLLGGAVVVKAALEVAGVRSVMVSEQDLLDGLMLQLLRR